VVEKLKQKYNREWFEETGPEYKIQVGLLKDRVTLTIDTTGPGLHKRGYREISAHAAPLKETLAAAMIELSFWRKGRILLDPVCGSGTIPIEAAMMARNIAPGLRREFVSEAWQQIDKRLWRDERAAAYCEIDTDIVPEIYGSDIDPKAIELARHNAEKAGVGDCVRFSVSSVSDAKLPGDYGVAICNPPYGERMGHSDDLVELYRDMRRLLEPDPTWSFYIITSDEDFEKTYGKKADTKRKLFNGMIKTDYYQFIGPRPPKP
jgi:putative N6-adenine-specific DNA methylase